MPGKLVVRTYAPARRIAMVASTGLLGAVALYLVFEMGHQKAGFDGIKASRQQVQFEARVAELEKDNHQMRVQLASGDSTQVAQVRERSELARTIGELQAELGRAQQDLEFYRAIANPLAANKPLSMRVQQFQVRTANAAERTYLLRFALNRPTRPEDSSAGTLAVSIDGERAGAAASADLATLTGGKVKELSYSFRYFTNVEQSVTMPLGFKPERVTIEIRPGRKGLAPYRQTFVWNPDSA